MVPVAAFIRPVLVCEFAAPVFAVFAAPVVLERCEAVERLTAARAMPDAVSAGELFPAFRMRRHSVLSWGGDRLAPAVHEKSQLAAGLVVVECGAYVREG